MIRIGEYSALDKWNALCRYWEGNDSVPDLGFNKFDRPRLTNWHDAAFRSASRACVDYVRAKADAAELIPPGDRASSTAACSSDAVQEEIAQLRQRIGYADLMRRVVSFTEMITEHGFAGSRDMEFSLQFNEQLKEAFKVGALRGLEWTDEAGEIPTIEILREQTSVCFPSEAIKNKKKVLSIFSARFYGRSDVIHIYDANPAHVTLVDIDKRSLEDMKLIYPKQWTYVHQDYESFLREAGERNLSHDLVVSDPFRGHGRVMAWDLLPVIMRLCTDTFITNYFVEMFEELDVKPDDCPELAAAIRVRTGVDVEVSQTIQRSRDVYWVVMRRADRAVSRRTGGADGYHA